MAIFGKMHFTVVALLLAANLCASHSSFLDAEDGEVLLRDRRSSHSEHDQDNAVLTYINEALGMLKELMKSGIPEFGVAPLEPLRLDNTSVDLRRSGAHVRANLSDMSLYGVSTLTVRKVSVSIVKQSLLMELSFQNWTVHGTYNMSGHLLKVLPISGVGPFFVEADDVLVTGSGRLRRMANGSLDADNIQLDVSVDSVKSHFKHLNGGSVASSVSNALVNALSKTIFERAKPKIVQKIADTLQKSLNKKLHSVHLPF